MRSSASSALAALLVAVALSACTLASSTTSSAEPTEDRPENLTVRVFMDSQATQE